MQTGMLLCLGAAVVWAWDVHQLEMVSSTASSTHNLYNLVVSILNQITRLQCPFVSYFH